MLLAIQILSFIRTSAESWSMLGLETPYALIAIIAWRVGTLLASTYACAHSVAHQCLPARPLPLLAGGAVLLDDDYELLVVAESCFLFSSVYRRHFSLRIHFSS